MTEYIAKSFHDLLAGESESPSDSDSSRGSHHPLRECFMAGTPEGYIESIHEGGATPTDDLDNKVEVDVGAPPRLWVEQLRAWHQELEEAHSSSSKNTRSSSERSSVMETVDVRMPWPTA